MNYSTHLLRHLRFTIGNNIHHHRVKQKISLQKLSRLSGVPEYLLDHYEIGKNEIALEELFRISCVLEVKIEKLMV